MPVIFGGKRAARKVYSDGRCSREGAGAETTPAQRAREGTILVRFDLRRAENDTPYALALASREKLAAAVADVFRKKVPLWHLAFLSPEMARLRGLGEDHLLFGAYPDGRRAEVEEALRDVAASAGGRVLSPAGHPPIRSGPLRRWMLR